MYGTAKNNYGGSRGGYNDCFSYHKNSRNITSFDNEYPIISNAYGLDISKCKILYNCNLNMKGYQYQKNTDNIIDYTFHDTSIVYSIPLSILPLNIQNKVWYDETLNIFCNITNLDLYNFLTSFLKDRNDQKYKSMWKFIDLYDRIDPLSVRINFLYGECKPLFK